MKMKIRTYRDHSGVKHHEDPHSYKAQPEANESDPDLLTIFEDHGDTRRTTQRCHDR
jgi:hypothetical protein